MMLDQNTEIGRKISMCIVSQHFDDDCMTDDGMKRNAISMIKRDITGGIEKYLQHKKNGTEK